MTERKPAGMSIETWIDRQIRTAQERGELDNLPGSGKPLPKRSDDEMEWIRGYVQREGLSTDALLPTPLRLRKEIEQLPQTVADLPTEQAVRETVSQLNRQIMEYLRAPSGPRVPVSLVNADAVVDQWHAGRGTTRHSASAAAAPHTSPAASRSPSPPWRASWWRRLTRRRRPTGE